MAAIPFSVRISEMTEGWCWYRVPAHLWSVAIFCGSTALAFAAASIWLAVDGIVVMAGIAVANCAVWGYGFVRSLRQGLYASSRGLIVRGLWRTTSLPWSEVADVTTSQGGGRPGLYIRTGKHENLRVNALSGSATRDPELMGALERVVADLERLRQLA